MTTFPIKIDAREVFGGLFQIFSVTPDWVSSAEVQTLEFEAGREYAYQVYSGGLSDVRFTVSGNGTVDYGPALDGVVSGRGTDTLTVHGVDITVDARYINALGVLLSVPLDEWISYRTVRLVPAPQYFLQQGSGQLVDFRFGVGVDGKVTYNPEYDLASGGFASGRGTSTLQLFGFPVLVDARAAGGAGVLIVPVNGLRFDETSVQLANILPPEGSFELQVAAGVVSQVRFGLSVKGLVTVDGNSADFLRVDKFGGVPRVTVTQPIPSS